MCSLYWVILLFLILTIFCIFFLKENGSIVDRMVILDSFSCDCSLTVCDLLNISWKLYLGYLLLTLFGKRSVNTETVYFSLFKG